MKKIISATILTLVLSACAGFKPDYIVRDASENSRPSWTVQKNAYKSDDSANKKKFRYYVNDAENPDQRLCLKSAEARATQKVASEIAQEIASRFSEKANSHDDESTRKVKEDLEQNIKVSLHGVAVQGKYWEKRQYSRELGAEKDKTAYKCDVAVRISNEALAEALEAYKTKTLNSLKESDKQPMKEAINSTIGLIKAGSPLAGAVADAVVNGAAE